MSEITEITVNLRGWVRDIITGDDLLNNSGQAILEKRHMLERAALEIESLRKANEDFHEGERKLYLENKELEAGNIRLQMEMDMKVTSLNTGVDLLLDRCKEFEEKIELIQRVNENLETVRRETATKCFDICNDELSTEGHLYGRSAIRACGERISREFGLEI